MTELILIDDMIEVGREMAVELTTHLEEMRRASGDDSDGKQLELLIHRWNDLYATYRAWVEEDSE